MKKCKWLGMIIAVLALCVGVTAIGCGTPQPETLRSITITGRPTADTVAIETTQSIQLGIEYAPENVATFSVEWSSDNQAVATVDKDGKVTVLHEGQTRIAATAGGGTDGQISDSFTLTVTKQSAVATAVAITDKPTNTIRVGDAGFQLGFTVTPDLETVAVEWASSNGGVARIDKDGNVTVLAAGVTDISVKVAGTSVKDSFRLTVLPAAIESIEIVSPPTVLRAGRTKVLSVATAPADCENVELVWHSSKPTVATVDDDGLLTAVAAGETTISVSAGETISDSFSLTVAAALGEGVENFDLSTIVGNAVEGFPISAKESTLSITEDANELPDGGNGKALKVVCAGGSWPGIKYSSTFIEDAEYTISFDIKMLSGSQLNFAYNFGTGVNGSFHFDAVGESLHVSQTKVAPAENITFELFIADGTATNGQATGTFVIDNFSIVPTPSVTITDRPTNDRIKLDASLTLSYNTTGAVTGTPAWTSGTSTVATVDGGVVTLLAPGTTLITLSIGDLTDSFTLTVLPDKYLELNDPIDAMRVGDTFDVAYETEAGTTGATVKSNNTDVVSVSGATLTAKAEGTAEITVSYSGLEKKFTVTVYKRLAAGVQDFETATVVGNAVEGFPISSKDSTLSITSDADELPDGGSDKALKVVCNGYYPGLQYAGTYTQGVKYTISFDIKWLSGTQKTFYYNFGGASGSIVFSAVGDSKHISAQHVASAENSKFELFIGGDSETGTFVIDNFSIVETPSVTITGKPTGNKVTIGAATLTLSYDTTGAVTGTPTWTSGTPTVATVDGGVVTLLATGTTVITLSIGDCEDSFTLTVLPDAYLEITDKVETMRVGDTFVVAYETEDGTTGATVESNNTDFVAVDGATLTARAEGTAEITVSYKGIEKKFTVTVYKQLVAGVQDFETATVTNNKVDGLTPIAAKSNGDVLSITAVADELPEGGSGKALKVVCGGGGWPGIIYSANHYKIGASYTVSFDIKLLETGSGHYSFAYTFGNNLSNAPNNGAFTFTDINTSMHIESSVFVVNATTVNLQLFMNTNAGTGMFVIDNFAIIENPGVLIVDRPANDEMLLGGSDVTLQAVLLGGLTGTQEWRSSDEGVATVAGGVLHAVGVGTTSITLTVGEYTATFTLNVVEPYIKIVDSLVSAEKQGTLSQGEWHTLKLQTVHAGAITFSSSDPAVATVSANGVIKALAAGTTTITATDGTLSDSFTLTVTAATIIAEEDFESATVEGGNVVGAKITLKPKASTLSLDGGVVHAVYTKQSWSGFLFTFSNGENLSAGKYRISMDITTTNPTPWHYLNGDVNKQFNSFDANGYVRVVQEFDIAEKNSIDFSFFIAVESATGEFTIDNILITLVE